MNDHLETVMKRIAAFGLELALGIAGWLWYGAWLLTNWHIPKDKLDPDLEPKLTIMWILPGWLSVRYLARQYRRQNLVEFREAKRIFPTSSSRIPPVLRLLK